MVFPPDIKSCNDVDDQVIDAAFAESSADGIRPRERVLRLLERMSRVARPGADPHRILEVLARLADADWLGGPLDVVVRDFGLATEIDVRIDQGARFERVRTLSLTVPVSELSSWASRHPERLAPLSIFGAPTTDELRLRLTPGSAPPGTDGDAHTHDTAKVKAVELPKEAYRPPMPSQPDRRPTIPAPRPVVQPGETKKDATDEGWES